jgi:ribosomal protein S18 acetylase RimI-like enzyme
VGPAAAGALLTGGRTVVHAGAHPGHAPAAPRLRRAEVADAAALAAFAARLFRETYGPAADPGLSGGSRPEDVEAYVAPHFAPALQTAELADPALTTFVAETDAGAIAAYAQLRAPSPHPAAPPGAAELARFYVDWPWQGRGVAGALMAALVDAARAAGARALWLAVLQRNARAVGFYRREGFRVVGTSTFRMGAEVQDDWIMVRDC